MAITLEELLERNKRPQQEQNKQYVPYDEFQNSRNNNENEGRPVFKDYTYDNKSEQSQSLYEFSRKEENDLRYQEFHAKLNYNNDSYKPVLHSDAYAQPTEEKGHTIFKHASVEEKEQVQETQKKKGHLNLKGKLIIAAYVAVVAVVAVLIIVNSGKLNLGKATTPSSSVSDYAIVETIK